jgi:arylsulfatase A-like enzyme/Flp pilus assembly protein TadD
MQRARRLGVLLLLAAGAALAACGSERERPTPGDRVERIVLVTIDTLRADHVGCYGAERAETPNLDALAVEGARFETAISPVALTLPAHTTLLTGRDPPQHGVRHNGLFALPPDVTPIAEHLRGQGFAAAAFVSAFVLDGRFGLERGFDPYDDRLGMRKLAGAAGAVPERRGDHTVDAALAWLDHAPDRFFLWVHLYDPHAEYEPPPPWSERFAGRLYDGEIAFADAQLGRLRARFAERWPAGTLWFVTADHGESLGEHGEKTHSFGVYEATQHVPLLAAGPGVPHGTLVRGVVALADVAPTALELAGLRPLPGATGQSVAAALRGDTEVARRAAWVETLATQFDMGWSPLLGVRTATHKYVRAPEPELYDLSVDPRELSNRAAELPALVTELDGLVEVGAAGRPVTPSFQPDADERARLEALGYLQGGANPPAAASLGKVGGFDPKRGAAEAAQVDQISALLTQRRGADALALYDTLRVRSYPVLLLGAAAALQASQPTRAEHEARLALALNEGPEPLITIGRALIQQQRSAEAKQIFERTVSLYPEQSEAWVSLGWLAELDGQTDEARRNYDHARLMPVPSPDAVWHLAALALEAGRREEANELLSQLAQAELRVPDAAYRLARAELTTGRPELARVRVEGALHEYPAHPELLLLKAELLDQAGDVEAALGVRREVLQLVPGRPDAENVVAWSLARLGRDLPEAEQRVESALEKLGRLPALLDTLAVVRGAQGRYRDALALADEGLAAAHGDDRVDLLFHRAEALAGLGRREEAESALALAKGDARARGPNPHTWPESEQRVRRLLDEAS